MRGRQALLTIVTLALLLAGAAVLIAPTGDLGEEAQLASLAPTDALARLDAMKGPLSPQLAFRQAELAAVLGDSARADALLARLAAQTSDTRVISVARADLALRSDDIAAAAGHLAVALNARPDALLRQRLGRLYRRLGDPAAERDMLAAVGVTDLTGPERIRLVDLTAAAGRTEEALALARNAVTRGGSDAPALFERFAAIALVTGAFDTLVEAAAGWLDQPDGQTLVRPFAAILATEPRDAIALATAVVALAPDVRAPLVVALAEAGVYGAARSLVQPLIASVPTDSDGWSALIIYADRSGDIASLETTLRRLPATATPPTTAFLPLVRYGGGQSLLPYRAWLTAERLADMPLVEAAWAIWLKRPDAAVDALQRAAQTGTDPALWRAVANEMRGTVHLDRLRALARTDTALAAMFDQ